ncbi:MAG: SNF2-related protein [Ekhidna sp.]|uniref:DEAD/DEAH box helicase n=1 Tax=Ekhidna sp. TaxID=2608089 RepID=UPI0032EB9298
MEITIQIDQKNPQFILPNSATELTQNKRLLVSLKRLGYSIDSGNIHIPFEESKKISTLDQIQRLLEKFGYSRKLSEETKANVESYEREERYFEYFTEMAESIRNDKFEEYPELVEQFKDFQTVVSEQLTRTLYPLQLLSAFHMSFAQNSCNFAVPGAGKTSIVYAAYSFLKNLPKGDPRKVDYLMVIGPISSFAPWENEYLGCFGQNVKSQRLSGDSSISRERKEEHLYSGNPAELTLIFHGGVDTLRKEITDFLTMNSTMVVVDEAHRIKNPDGVWGRSAVEISKEAKARVVLTGTPVPNGYEDLYNLYQFIYPFKFKKILGFHYPNLVELTKNSNPDSERVQRFTQNISPFFIRIKKRDLNLPPTKEKIIEVDMSSYQREIYDFIETEYVHSFRSNPDGSVKEILNRAKLIRLRQATTNPSLLARPLKNSLLNNQAYGEYDPNSRYADSTDEFIDDSEFFHRVTNYHKVEIPNKFIEVQTVVSENAIKKGAKALIWTIFIQNAKELQMYLEQQDIQSRLLIGETEQFERESIISKFNDPNNHDFQVVIANPFAVAESISLHKGCHLAIYLERDYNCSNFLQSKDRIHRVGLSPDQVTEYYYIISSNSIDGIIDYKLREKVERMEAIIDEDIPLFRRLDDDDETDLIKALILDYAKRS